METVIEVFFIGRYGRFLRFASAGATLLRPRKSQFNRGALAWLAADDAPAFDCRCPLPEILKAVAVAMNLTGEWNAAGIEPPAIIANLKRGLPIVQYQLQGHFGGLRMFDDIIEYLLYCEEEVMPHLRGKMPGRQRRWHIDAEPDICCPEILFRKITEIRAAFGGSSAPSRMSRYSSAKVANAGFRPRVGTSPVRRVVLLASIAALASESELASNETFRGTFSPGSRTWR
jgi:hypothetical protein